MRHLAGLLVPVILAGCADPARNLYEGMQSQRDAARTPMERAVQPSVDYDSYQKALEQSNAK